jgi:Predicted metal-binding, possibly nucleic acid-binding protein
MKSFNLRQAKLRSGEEYRDEIELELEPLEFGGERYLPVPGTVPAELALTKATTGTVFELAFTARLHGPCYRCLGDAVLELPIRAREYQATNPQGSDELRTPYLVDDNLDLAAWARDAVALALPDKILCRADCAGLCGVCGKNLNDEPHTHDETPSDSRWAALEALREKL